MTANSPEHAALEVLEREDRKWTWRNRAIVAGVVVFNLAVAGLVSYELSIDDIGYRSIKCEQGDVILVLEKANGQVERVECPAEVPIRK